MILWGVYCTNWSARDLRSVDNYAKARSYVFKIFFQPSSIRILDKAIYYRFDHFRSSDYLRNLAPQHQRQTSNASDRSEF
jgi:hypothetical protein